MSLCVVSLPLLLAIPIAWLYLPKLVVDFADYTIALGISLLTIGLHLLVTTARTINTFICGYGIDCNFYNEIDDLHDAMQIVPIDLCYSQP